MAARGFLGAGDLYIARYDSTLGDFGQYVGPYNAEQFAITPNTNVKELIARGKANYGQVLESVPVPAAFDFSIVLTEVNQESLALALLGTAEDIATGSATVTDQVTIGHLDKWTKLLHNNISETGFVLTNSAASTTYVRGTDYIVNFATGMWKALSTGAITEAQSLKVDYAALAVDGVLIRGATQTQLRAKFMLDGTNMADGSPCIVTVHEAVMAPSGEVDFLADDFGRVTLPGRMKTPTGLLEPFTVELRTA